MAITVVDLLKERKEPTVAQLDEPVEVAVERMMEHDFSQLPVMKHEVGHARLVGMVSMTSIARAVLHTRSPLATLQVMHALEPKPVRIKLEATMWDALELLQRTKALLVVDDEDRLRGLLTDYDCATELRRRSENLLALEDVEVGIRLIIRSLHRDREDDLRAEVTRQMEAQPKSAFGNVRRIVNDCLASLSVEKSKLPNDVFDAAFRTHYIKRASAEFERLDFSHYVDILLGSCWAACKDAFRLPQAEVRGLLDTVRVYRNRLAHHRDPLTHVERDRLMYCRDLIGRVVASVVSPPLPGGSPAPEGIEEVFDATPDVGVGDGRSSSEVPEDAGGYEPFDGSQAGSRPRLQLDFSRLRKKRVTWPFKSLGDLPGEARHLSWWSNDEDKAHARDWLDRGWRVASVNLSEETVTFERNTDRAQAYITVFGALFRKLEESPAWQWKERRPSPTGRSWQTIASVPGNSGARFVLAFTFDGRFRVDLYIDSGDRDANKRLLHDLRVASQDIQPPAGSTIEWQALESARASRVALYYPSPVEVWSSEEEHVRLADWVRDTVPWFCTIMIERYRVVAQHA